MGHYSQIVAGAIAKLTSIKTSDELIDLRREARNVAGNFNPIIPNIHSLYANNGTPCTELESCKTLILHSKNINIEHKLRTCKHHSSALFALLTQLVQCAEIAVRTHHVHPCSTSRWCSCDHAQPHRVDAHVTVLIILIDIEK